MNKMPIFDILLFLLAFSANCQNFKFQRFIECQNNEFEIVEEHPETDLQESNRPAQNMNESLKSIQSDKYIAIETPSQVSVKEQPQKKVRCKKWVQSYKIVEKNHLRKDVQTQVLYQEKRKPLEAINKRGLMTITEVPQTPQISAMDDLIRRGGRSGSTSTGSNQQQAARLMSLYFHITMMNNILIYTEG